MRGLIEQYLDDRTLARIAAAHAEGRRLFVVTSNLDTGRAVVWDMGAIAKVEDSDLFRAVTLASASIPGVFPPVTLRLPQGRETHVDGGVNMQLLAVPEAAFANFSRVGGHGGQLYVIVNNTLGGMPAPVSRRTLPIMEGTFITMVRAEAASSVSSARRYATRTGMKFHLATIRSDFDRPWDPSHRFDPTYMTALYAYGRNQARVETAFAAG